MIIKIFTLISIFQRYNLKAIHNDSSASDKLMYADFNISKIQFESNSQHTIIIAIKAMSWFQYFKDTIWKQFTTPSHFQHFRVLLISIFQRYNLKAIHNRVLKQYIIDEADFNISKIQFESNSQLYGCVWSPVFCWFQYFKDTIWKQFTTVNAFLLFKNSLISIFQRYNLKAIHNNRIYAAADSSADFNISKIQFESNSQLDVAKGLWKDCWFQYFKDTIWKQFTTNILIF